MKNNKFASGFVQSEESKIKKSLTLKGNKNALGHKHTEEWKEEVSKRQKGNKHALGKTPHNKGKYLSHCKRGHPFDEKNTYTNKSNGKRKCRVCCREFMRRKRASTK